MDASLAISQDAHSRKMMICSWNIAPYNPKVSPKDSHKDSPKDSRRISWENTHDLLNKTLCSIQPHLVLLQEPLWNIDRIIEKDKNCDRTVYESGGSSKWKTYQVAILYDPKAVLQYKDEVKSSWSRYMVTLHDKAAIKPRTQNRSQLYHSEKKYICFYLDCFYLEFDYM